MNEEQEKKLVKAYLQSGDASHAYRKVGIELNDGWTEQKRNARGLVEILESDLHLPEEATGMNAMEYAESVARSDGLYDGLPQSLPEEATDAAVALTDADKMLKIARESIAPERFAIFLAVEVDNLPLRTVAKEFNLSYRQGWQTVDSVRDSLRRIAEEYENKA